MYVLVCQNCGNQFTNQRHHRKFCSQKCYHGDPTTVEERKERQKKYLKGSCKDCGVAITAKGVRCLDCHQKHKSETTQKSRLTEKEYCSKCNIKKTPENTFLDKTGLWGERCRNCRNQTNKKSSDRQKQDYVDYKGGKCERCSYNKCLAALHFHHLDPSKKDFNIAHRRADISNIDIQEELNKCILLCANCHAEEHQRLKEEL